MSCYLWKFFLEDDVDRFRHVLAQASYVAGPGGQKGNTYAAGSSTRMPSSIGSPGAMLASSPTLTTKSRKYPSGDPASSNPRQQPEWSALVLTRADVNLRDRNGLTILHHAVSSNATNAPGFAMALLAHPLLDLHSQDLESGWTVLHRALYFGNVTIARVIMKRDLDDALGVSKSGVSTVLANLLKIKDREGNSPFDLFNLTTKQRIVNRHLQESANEDEHLEEEDLESAASGEMDDSGHGHLVRVAHSLLNLEGDEVFMFGSNKNMNLGFGDEDDRAFPERVTLRRPDHLLHRFYHERQQARQACSLGGVDEEDQTSTSVPIPTTASLPAVIKNRLLRVQDVSLAKLHTAVLTTDPEANLFVCGFGPGGRLGTGDDMTRFSFVCVEGGGLEGRKVVSVGLGQNHTLAVTSEGDIFSWGSNVFGQLGYTLPRSGPLDEEPVQTLPRQIFGPLKRETVIGVAASSIHSVVYTSNSLFTFGKNEGQLGLVDSDARSLDMQMTPRKVAASLFSASIKQASAIDRATVCLLENHEVWVFANYGYAKLSFPLDGTTNYFMRNSELATRYDNTPNHVCKVTSGGDMVCALTSSGEVFTLNVSRQYDPSPASSSTTNPAKIRNALSPPQRIWTVGKGHMAVRDVDVGQDGTVVICTQSGSVWRRTKRAKIKDAQSTSFQEYRPKDYKFSRVPGLSRIIAVRSNNHGAYAAVRRDCDVTKTQIIVQASSVRDDFTSLLAFRELLFRDYEDERPRLWLKAQPRDGLGYILNQVLAEANLEHELTQLVTRHLEGDRRSFDAMITSGRSDFQIPAHQFLLSARSPVMAAVLAAVRAGNQSDELDLVSVSRIDDHRLQLNFPGLDSLTIINLVLFTYTDTLLPIWSFAREMPKCAFRFRQVRTELMKLALRLEIRELEAAVRVMRAPIATLQRDMTIAMESPAFLDDGDVIVELDGAECRVHSALVCQRCPFFQGLFNGRAAGGWLSARQYGVEPGDTFVKVDLKHVNPDIFRLILRHIYADCGQEIFDDAVTDDLDEFIDLIMEVMSVANELMLDRLSQSCQKLLGRFVNTRNVCQLLNAVAPCSVTEFKDTCLEYICMNLAGMLELHLLDNLDEDLMLDLDAAVRTNQLSCHPYSRSGQAESRLQEQHPDLLEARERERQARIASLTTHPADGVDDATGRPTKSKGSLIDLASSSPSEQKPRRKSSKNVMPGSASAALTSRKSATDLIFEMDEEGGNKEESSARFSPRVGAASPNQRFSDPSTPVFDAPKLAGSLGSEVEAFTSVVRPDFASPRGPSNVAATPSPLSPSAHEANQVRRPWGPTKLSSSELNLKNIMAQTTSNRISSLSAGLAQESRKAKASPSAAPKLSQRERKKQVAQLTQSTSPALAPETPKHDVGASSPWQVKTAGRTVSLKDVLSAEEQAKPSPSASLPRMSGIPALSLPDPTVSDALPKNSLPHRPQSRGTVTSPIAQSCKTPLSPNMPQASSPLSRPHNLPHSTESILAASSASSPPLNLPMSEIISQQRAEQELLRQAVAKRSLSEIQQEQEFMEWWELESRKVRGEGVASAASPARAEGGSGGGGGGTKTSARGKSKNRRGGGAPRGGRGGKAEASPTGPGRGRGAKGAPSSSSGQSPRGRGAHAGRTQ
ncbi:MAG: hypothetical protein M1817_000443 [Caeruleum heppii]|nr:MAG: hypothetical protein M1817_000443 [Caeruleum heppii]